MIDIILLGGKGFDYLLNENNNIPITIIKIFLALLNHSFHNDKGTFIHSNFQSEVNLNQVSNVQLNVKIKPHIFSVIQEYYPDRNEHHLYAI